MKNLICASAAALLFFLAGGLTGVLIEQQRNPRLVGVSVLWDYVYTSTVNGETAIKIKPDGSSEIGPKYDRSTEAIKLFEMVQAWKNEGLMPDCHETSYRSRYWSKPDRGVMQVFPGTPDPTPRIEWLF